jgi:hypothetical protein
VPTLINIGAHLVSIYIILCHLELNYKIRKINLIKYLFILNKISFIHKYLHQNQKILGLIIKMIIINEIIQLIHI